MANKTDNTEIVPATTDTDIAPVSMSDIVDSTGKFINTVNMDTFEGKVKVVNALNSAHSLKDATDVLSMTDIITMPGVRKGRNGMPDTQCTNTYIIDSDGIAWFSQSDGVARSAMQLASIFKGNFTGNELGYLPVKVMEQDLPNGNTIKNLVIAM